MTEDEYDQQINNLLEDRPSSNKLLVDSFKKIYNKDNIKILFFSFLLVLIPSFIISFSQDTVSIYKEMIDDLLNIIIAIFGIVFTAFALLQAYINTTILKGTLPKKLDKKSKNKTNENKKIFIHQANENFAFLLMISLSNVVILFLLKLILYKMPTTLLILESILISNIICALLSTLLLTIIMYNIISTKTIIRDLYLLFNLGTLTAICEIEEKRIE